VTDTVNAAVHQHDLFLGIVSKGVAAQLLAYGSAFLAVFLIMALISFFLSRAIKEMGLTVVDRLLGALFGLLRGFLLGFLVYAVCAYVKDVDTWPEWAQNSTTVPVMRSTYAWADEKFDFKSLIGKVGDIAVGELQKNSDKAAGKKHGDDARKSSSGDAEKELKDDLSREEKEREPPLP
jgi:hypothetical protein